GPGKSGAEYVRSYAQENDIYSANIVCRLLREKKNEGPDVSGIIFVDDFIGTGSTLAKGVKEFMVELGEIVRKREIRVCIVVIAGFEKARNRLQAILKDSGVDFKICVVDILGESARAFSEE